jgi:hypothetical protein
MPSEKNKHEETSLFENETVIKDDSNNSLPDAVETPTRIYAVAVNGEPKTKIQSAAPDTEPTKILSETDKEIESEAIEEETAGPNALRPNRLRTTLVLLLLLTSAVWTLFNFGLLSRRQIDRDWRYLVGKNAEGFHKVSSVRGGAAEKLKPDDELVGYNGKPFNSEEFLKAESELKPGDRYALEAKRRSRHGRACSAADQPGRTFPDLSSRSGFSPNNARYHFNAFPAQTERQSRYPDNDFLRASQRVYFSAWRECCSWLAAASL